MNEALLKAIADTLLPGDQAGLPIGSDIAVVIEALRERATPFLPLLPPDFSARDITSRAALLRDVEQRAFQPFRDMVLAALKAYYEDKRVLAAMGADPAPPQPQGMKLAPMADDLKPALDRVRARGAIWRKTT
jgi:hypothetical protein